MKKVIVVGGGASGMIAAIFAARNGAAVALFEKNEKLGKKLFITGKGRCNFTNICGVDELLANVVNNPRFLYSAFSAFDSAAAVGFFEELGVKVKIERGRRAFPASDHSSDIIKALKSELNRLKADVFLCTKASKLFIKDGAARGVYTNGNCLNLSDAVIIASGGLAYPSAGAGGDGYLFAKEAGMKITALRPALVPIETKEDYVKELQGLSLKNVEFKVEKNNKVLFREFGEMVFTHFGISGPIVIKASSFIGEILEKENLAASIDLKPALSLEELDLRILREFSGNKNKHFKNAAAPLFPAKLLPVIVGLSGIDPDTPVNSISKAGRLGFALLIKNFRFTLTSLRPYSEAVITSGGVDVKELNPSTMESKKIRDLYFAGEVIDVDSLTGGYNLQNAWSTGFLAGTSSAIGDCPKTAFR